MTNECPSCGRIHPGYIRECKCGHSFVDGTNVRMDRAKRIAIGGRELTCAHCGANTFTGRHAQLNTSAMTFFDLEWLNKSAEVFVCTGCGRLEWFLDPSLTILDDDSESA